MTIRLFVRPQIVRPQAPATQPGETLDWSLYSFAGELIGSGSADKTQLEEIVSQYNLEDILLHFIVPASDFSYITADIPAKQARHVQQALPYVIEDLVAEDIEDMHLVIGEKLPKQHSMQGYPVLLTRSAQMQIWYDAAKDFNFPLHGIYVDSELCRIDQSNISVLIDGEDALVYAEGVSCLRTPVKNLTVYLDLLSTKLGDVVKLTVIADAPSQAKHNVLLAELEQIEGLQIEISIFTSTIIDVLSASWFNQEKLTNLCNSQFPGVAQATSSGIKKWWPLAAVASLWFVIQVTFDVAEGFIHQRKAQEYRQQSVAIYQQLFPAEHTIASPRRQLEGKLRRVKNSRAESGFLVLLGDAGYHLSRQPQKSRMTLNNMQYSQTRGELAMEITAPSLDDLDRYKQSITEAGYQVSIGSAIKEDNSVRGKLTVQGG